MEVEVSIASVTIDGEVSRPFRLAGATVEELFGDGDPDALADLDAAIDRNTRRASVADTLRRLDRHPGEIAKHLRHGGRQVGSKQRLDPPGPRR